MTRLFSFLLTGCWHHWEIHKETELIRRSGNDVVARGQRYILRCKHCGDIKVKDTV